MSSRRPLRGIHLPFVLIGGMVLAIVAGQATGPSNLFGAEDERPPQKWALLIGIDEYANLPGLKFAGADERDLGAQLIKAGFAADHVFVMHDHARKRLLPLKANIERRLELLLDPTKGLVGKGDLVIVGFSGHGISLDGKSWLCPSDAQQDDPPGTMILLENIYRQLARCPATLKLMLLDACRSNPAVVAGGNVMSRGFATSMRKPPRGVLLLNSCNIGQMALDDPALGHGIFMQAVLNGLAGKAARADGNITLMGLYIYAGALTRKSAAKKFKSLQTPALEGRTEGNFELCRIPRDPPPEDSVSPPDENKPAPVLAKLVVNSIGMKLALIPAGEFMMGSPETEIGSDGLHEQIEEHHRVQITRPFYMGVYEVTQSQFQAIMGKNPSRFSTIGPLKDALKGLNTSFFPVENVSLDDTQEFCRRLSELEGRHYRLPTEAEWEYACRAGTSDPFSFGAACNGKEANCNGTAPYGTKIKGPFLDRTTKVGSYPPNAFGLYDMHGNVWERCSDWYDGKYYPVSPPEDPEGPAIGSYRVSRGGGWNNAPAGCRSAARYGFVPSFQEVDLGFRVSLIP